MIWYMRCIFEESFWHYFVFVRKITAISVITSHTFLFFSKNEFVFLRVPELYTIPCYF